MSGFLSNTVSFLNRNKTKLASLVAAGSAGYYIYQYINGEQFIEFVLITLFTFPKLISRILLLQRPALRTRFLNCRA